MVTLYLLSFQGIHTHKLYVYVGGTFTAAKLQQQASLKISGLKSWQLSRKSPALTCASN